MNIRVITNAAAVLLVAGCSKDPRPSRYKAATTEVTTVAGDFVTPRQVKSVAQKMFPQTRVSAGVGIEVEAVTDAAGDTLMYIVNNPGGGWKVLSADARTPAVLAEGAEGSFSIENACDGLKVWMDCLASDMEAVRSAATDELNFTSEEISANRSFWGADAQPAALSPTLLPNPGGEWKTRTTTVVHVVDSAENTTPRWSQNNAYSAYCPLKSNSSEDRAPAGCVAVAGAEVLYYLHNKFGVPATMVSEGYCNGNLNGYARAFYNSNTSIWSQMTSEHKHIDGTANAEALMIGHIGDIINMHYRERYSWAWPANLVNPLFSTYGIQASSGSYDEDVVKSNLEAALPVIVTATTQAIPVNFNIHCFVIDGYKRTYTEYVHLHYWYSYDFETWYDPDEYASYYTYSYSDPVITAVTINWGCGEGKSGWFTLIGDWVSPDDTNYRHNRSMIYDITIQDNEN